MIARQMVMDALPDQVNLRKLIATSAEMDAEVSVRCFPRVCDALPDIDSKVLVHLDFFQDESGLKRISGKVSTPVIMICQRCLEPVELLAEGEISLAVVWTEAEAAALPRWLDPVVCMEEQADLLTLVEEELLLALPVLAYHDQSECCAPDSDIAGDLSESTVVDDSRDNPFKVLESLRGHLQEKQEK